MSAMRALLARVLLSLRSGGLLATVRLVGKNLLHHLRWYLDGAFDRRYGTRTSAVIPADALAATGANARHAVYYEPTPTRIFLHLMRRLGIRYEEFIFCDFGSGMGRTLLLASTFPFREVVGVEFSEALHRQALENARVYRSGSQRCRNITPLCMDAAEYVFPPVPTVLFFYNPFQAPVMRAVLANLEKSLVEWPRKVLLVYYNPLSGHLIEESGCLPNQRIVALPYDYTRVNQRRAILYDNFLSGSKERGLDGAAPVRPAG
jgi:hypothetical protein